MKALVCSNFFVPISTVASFVISLVAGILPGSHPEALVVGMDTCVPNMSFNSE